MKIEMPSPHSGVPLSKFQERWVHMTFIGLLFSGVGWLILHHFFLIKGSFGVEENPYQAWCLKVHGAAAMGFMVVLGALIPIHMRRNWLIRRNIGSAVPLVLSIVAMIVTGYGLYYVGSEHWRPWISAIHWIAGLLSVPILAVHVILARRVRKETSRELEITMLYPRTDLPFRTVEPIPTGSPAEQASNATASRIIESGDHAPGPQESPAEISWKELI
jgi:hypothetical protein